MNSLILLSIVFGAPFFLALVEKVIFYYVER